MRGKGAYFKGEENAGTGTGTGASHTHAALTRGKSRLRPRRKDIAELSPVKAKKSLKARHRFFDFHATCCVLNSV